MEDEDSFVYVERCDAAKQQCSSDHQQSEWVLMGSDGDERFVVGGEEDGKGANVPPRTPSDIEAAVVRSRGIPPAPDVVVLVSPTSQAARGAERKRQCECLGASSGYHKAACPFNDVAAS